MNTEVIHNIPLSQIKADPNTNCRSVFRNNFFLWLLFKMNTEVIHNIPLSQIKIDPNTNCRSMFAVEDEISEDGTGGIEALKDSIYKDGQRVPVVVMPLDEKTRMHQLVSGFQRYECIQRLWLDTSLTKFSTIKAVIRSLTELESRIENLTENTQRNNLSAADTVWGLARILEINSDFSPTYVATLLNKSTASAYMYYKIAKHLRNVYIPPNSLSKNQYLPVAMLRAWRVAPTPPTLQAMAAIADMQNEEERVNRFLIECGIKKNPSPKLKFLRGHGSNLWVVNTSKRLEVACKKLLELETHGLLTLSRPFFDKANIRLILSSMCNVKSFKDADDEDFETLCALGERLISK